jgi:hypothetical protein
MEEGTGTAAAGKLVAKALRKRGMKGCLSIEEGEAGVLPFGAATRASSDGAVGAKEFKRLGRNRLRSPMIRPFLLHSQGCQERVVRAH